MKVLMTFLISASMFIHAATPTSIPQKDTMFQDPAQKAIKNNSNVIVAFVRPNCPYCIYIKPHFKELRMQLSTSVIMLEVDVSTNPTFYKTTYGFNTVPTIAYFKDGELIHRHGSNNQSITTNDMKAIASRIYASH